MEAFAQSYWDSRDFRDNRNHSFPAAPEVAIVPVDGEGFSGRPKPNMMGVPALEIAPYIATTIIVMKKASNAAAVTATKTMLPLDIADPLPAWLELR